MMDLSIVISSFNRNDKVLETLRSLCANDLAGIGDVEVIIIDDGSPRPVEPLLMQLGKVPENFRIRVIKQDNAGIGPTRNLGFRESANDLVLFLDDDIIMEKGSLRKIIESTSAEQCGVVFGSYPFVTHESESLGMFASKFYGYDRLSDEPSFEYINGIASGFLWVTKSKLGIVGDLYRNDLKIPAAEEHELIFRFRQSGRQIAHARHISATHNHHLELAWIADQQYKYGLATAEAFQKYPDIVQMPRFAELKTTLDGGPRMKKFMKDLVSSALGRTVGLTLARLVQKLSPNADHGRVFALVTTAHFRGGYKDGTKQI